MSAGRCWPLVTFTMSPTATLWTGQGDAGACQRNREVEERREVNGRVNQQKKVAGDVAAVSTAEAGDKYTSQPL